MTQIIYNGFVALLDELHAAFAEAPKVHTEKWQSVDISQMPHMGMREILHYSFGLMLPTESLGHYRADIGPNLPWADKHFEQERVSGEPLNPGTTYLEWTPGAQQSGNNASMHLREGQQFDHSYAERYWPKWAGMTPGGELNETDAPVTFSVNIRRGIRFAYGDLNTLVDLLSGEPLTRQAYLPVWFPEDLYAAMEPKRVPCTLGYHFIMRGGFLDVVYYIRSCDFVRHFKDDVYLTIRLLLWVLQQCRLAAPEKGWADVKPGKLVMHITSLHMFEADHKRMYREARP